jgi:purine nucleoside permease
MFGNRAEFKSIAKILCTTNQITVQGLADVEPGADSGAGSACASSTNFRSRLAQVIADLLKGSRLTR